MFDRDLAEAKRELYQLLLEKGVTKITDLELDIAHALSGDAQIQEILKENLKLIHSSTG